MYQFKMPDIGEGTHETEITQWFFAEGDTIHEDDVLVEVQSDKALAELPCPVTGTIAKLYVGEGEMALVGSVIADITTADGGDLDSAAPRSASGEDDNAPRASEQHNAPRASEQHNAPRASAASRGDAGVVGVAPESAVAPREDLDSAAPRSAGVEEDNAPRASAASRGDVDVRTLAVPRVRKYARSKDVDLTAVTGTGNHGKITIEDVDAFLANGGATPVATEPQRPAETPVEAEIPAQETTAPRDAEQAGAQPAAPDPRASAPHATDPRASAPHGTDPRASEASRGAGERREKMPAIRKVAAKAMTEAAAVPTVTVLDRAEVSALVEHRNRLKGVAAQQDTKLTYTPYVVKACVAMLKKYPQLNGRVDMAAGEYVYYDTFHIGVATNTDQGLFVPVVKDADRKSLFEIAREITALGEQAQAGTLSRAQMSGGSLTITNVGGAATGGVWSTPILNGNEAAIVGIGRFEEEFLPDENRQPVLKPVTKLSFTFDHRFADGVTVQGAINDLKEFLHNPDLLLAES